MQEDKRNDAEQEQPEEEIKVSGKKVPREKLEKALAELEKAKADVEHWKNEYDRAYADTQNLRRSLEEESRTAIRYRAEGFLSNLLPALDGFHMALDAPAQSDEVRNYLVGFQYIYNQIQKTLEDEGVKEVSPKVGDDYDLNEMHAVDVKETDECAPGKVLQVYAKGYRLHDRLIRPAMVLVSKAKAAEAEKKEEEQGEAKEKDASLA